VSGMVDMSMLHQGQVCSLHNVCLEMQVHSLRMHPTCMHECSELSIAMC
jgi:hypothetical protein